MNESIITIQETLAHQAAEVARLSEELYAQQREIAALKLQVQRMRDEVESSLAQAMGGLPHEKPPHY